MGHPVYLVEAEETNPEDPSIVQGSDRTHPSITDTQTQGETYFVLKVSHRKVNKFILFSERASQLAFHISMYCISLVFHNEMSTLVIIHYQSLI